MSFFYQLNSNVSDKKIKADFLFIVGRLSKINGSQWMLGEVDRWDVRYKRCVTNGLKSEKPLVLMIPDGQQ